jgi:hypothetical protein
MELDERSDAADEPSVQHVLSDIARCDASGRWAKIRLFTSRAAEALWLAMAGEAPRTRGETALRAFGWATAFTGGAIVTALVVAFTTDSTSTVSGSEALLVQWIMMIPLAGLWSGARIGLNRWGIRDILIACGFWLAAIAAACFLLLV